MAANTSPWKARQAVMASPLTDFAPQWELHIDCGSEGCQRGRRIPMGQVEAYGRSIGVRTVAEMTRRLRCNECGRLPEDAALVLPPEAPRRRTVVVYLAGKGVPP